MSLVFDDAYWAAEFSLTENDLNRLAIFIEGDGQAQPLSSLAKRIVNGRLRYGPEQSTPLNQIFGVKGSVRRWDPGAEWESGDLVLARITLEDEVKTEVGEVLNVKHHSQGRESSIVEINFPQLQRLQNYSLLEANNPFRLRILQNIDHDIALKKETLAANNPEQSRAEMAELILYEHGERLIGQIRQGLSVDDRFVHLNGRYFLRSLSIPPAEVDLELAAHILLREIEPQSTSALFDLVLLDKNDDAHLFGFYLALRDHPQWFQNTQPGQRPLWTLAGPPPGSFSAKYAAYDPETYEILCLPEQEIAADAGARLWQLELFSAVL